MDPTRGDVLGLAAPLKRSVIRLEQQFQQYRQGFTMGKVQRETMQFTIDLEQEEDGRWIAEIPELPGTLVYGVSPEEARAKAQALALRVVADRLEHGEAGDEFASISFNAA